MENKIWQWLVKTWNALTGKISLAVQIASVLSLTLVSVLVVLLVVNWLGVSESFFRLLEILLSPTVIICALVLYLWRRHEAHIGDILGWIPTLQSLGPNLAPAKSDNLTSDPVSFRSKSDNKSEASPSDTTTSSGSPNNFNEIAKKAEQKDANAQFNLGTLYRNGEGVEKNDAEAAKWYRLAALQGNAEAQFSLGVLYGRGEGVEKNDAEAAKWYRLAADQGDAKARFNLGVLYHKGEGIEQNHAKAAKWYRLAADQGVVEARFNLGLLYYSGKGVEKNHTEAAKCFRLATDQGIAEAQFSLGLLYDSGKGVEKNHAEAANAFVSPPSKGMPKRRSTSALHITTAKV